MKHAFAMVLGASLLAWPAARGLADEVVVYRCTDASGRVTLGNEPCAKGATQERRTMARPQDPPPRPASTRGSAPGNADARATVSGDAGPPPVREIVYRTAPRPFYECVTPEGERYTSRTDDGNPRWVTTYTGLPYGYGGYGYGGGYGGGGDGGPGAAPRPAPVPRGGASFALGRGDTNLGARVSAPEVDRAPRPDPGVRPPRRGGPDVVVAGGYLVRDECAPLPQDEACARLRDERFDLIRRYNSALQSDRDRLVRQQRGIEAELSADCGGA